MTSAACSPRSWIARPTIRARVKVMAFPPLGIQTLAPVLRQQGHGVRMFDTCHPEMKAEHLAQAVEQERPDVIGISFLSTTTYPAAKRVAGRLKSVAPRHPHHRWRPVCHGERGPYLGGLPAD